jgi:hypothetical protein
MEAAGMSFDEQELRRRLAAAAMQASAPRFSVESLARRIRRRRAQVVGAVSAPALAVAALAVAVPVALSGAGSPVRGHPAVLPFSPSVTLTMIDVSRHHTVRPAAHVPQPLFAVSPGERLVIHVDVTVPLRATVTALWLGITGDVWGSGPGGRPAGMYPVLAHTRHPLRAGEHRFRFGWTVPAWMRAGNTRWLTMAWTFKNGETVGGIAQFGVPPLPSPPGPAAPPLPSPSGSAAPP